MSMTNQFQAKAHFTDEGKRNILGCLKLILWFKPCLRIVAVSQNAAQKAENK